MRYFTSDTHFYHNNIIDYCDRPFNNHKEMNQTIIENWNDEVGKLDIVYHLGDVGVPWRKKDCIEMLEELNGNIKLIMGNHDTQYEVEEFEHLCEEVHKKYCDIDLYLPGEDTTVEVRLQHNPHNVPVNGEFCIVGHVHDDWKFKPNTLNVGVDVWDFTPIPEPKVASYYKTNRSRREYSRDNFGYYDPRLRIKELEGRVQELENKLESE